MTYEEKKQILNNHKKEKNYYYAILALICLNFIYGLIVSIPKFKDISMPDKTDLAGFGLIPAGMVIVALIIAIGLQVLYFYGILRLQGWVTIFMWIGFIGSILSFDLVNIIITAVILFGYKKVLKIFKSTIPAQPKPQS